MPHWHISAYQEWQHRMLKGFKKAEWCFKKKKEDMTNHQKLLCLQLKTVYSIECVIIKHIASHSILFPLVYLKKKKEKRGSSVITTRYLQRSVGTEGHIGKLKYILAIERHPHPSSKIYLQVVWPHFLGTYKIWNMSFSFVKAIKNKMHISKPKNMTLSK